MRVVALIGEPATGKTTITLGLLPRLGPGNQFKSGLVTGTVHTKSKVIVLGTYPPGEKFSGTDRLSMGVQPAAVYFLQQKSFAQPDWSVFFEGDRLGNRKFLETCKALGALRLFILTASEEAKSLRHRARGDSQSETFLKGRKTKIENLRLAFPERDELKNETDEDKTTAISKVHQALTEIRT